MNYKAIAHILCVLGGLSMVGFLAPAIIAQSGPTPAVRFRIQPRPVGPTAGKHTRSWLATYDAGGKTARFRIELALKPTRGDSPFAFTSGTFYREPKSEASVLLRDLKSALDATQVPRKVSKVNRLPFDAAILGRSLSRGRDGGGVAGAFKSAPAGTWIATKVFVAGGEGEFYLNLDPSSGVGEIAIKDSEYGDVVLKELAKVL